MTFIIWSLVHNDILTQFGISSDLLRTKYPFFFIMLHTYSGFVVLIKNHGALNVLKSYTVRFVFIIFDNSCVINFINCKC